MKVKYNDVQKMLNNNYMFLEYCNRYFIDYEYNYYFKCYNTLLHRYLIVKCDNTCTPIETILLK